MERIHAQSPPSQTAAAALFGAARLREGTKKGGTTPAHPFFDSAQALQLEGGLKTREDALAWLREELARPA